MLANDLAETISLDGEWQFALGEARQEQAIQVPGCWESQGWPKTVDGPARYHRAIRLPEAWRGRHIQLECDAVSYACVVTANGRPAGAHQGMWTPFAIDLTDLTRPGEENQLALEVTKPGSHPGARYPMRASLAGFLPDLATTFGGIWQPVRLRALEAGLAGLQVRSDYGRRAIQVECRAECFGRERSALGWEVLVLDGDRVVAGYRAACPPDQTISASLPVPRAKNWSPAHPNLFTVRVTLLAGDRPLASVSRMVGFRRLEARGEQLLLNGAPFLVRGILAWGWEPDRIVPYYTLEQARLEMRRARSMGFNCIKLCLFVPNPAYFQAADEEGMLLWQELPMWLPEVTPQLRAQAPLEYASLAELVSPHPSVALYSLGCELNRSVDLPLLSRLNDVVRARVRDCLVCDNSGSGESYGGLEVDFTDFTDYHPYYDVHFFEPLLDHWRRDWQPPRPWIFGEFCDSDTFRDLDEIVQANGGQPTWWMTLDNPVTTWRAEAQALLVEEERLAGAGLAGLKAELARISHAQAAAIRKYTLEALRRRRAMGGYIITGLRDTPISTSGVWDDLGRAKWPEEDFLRSNGEDVLSLDFDRRRTWRYGGDRPDRLDPYNHWSGSPARWHVILHAARRAFPPGGQLRWQLTRSGGALVASGEHAVDQRIPALCPIRLGVIDCALPTLSRTEQLELTVTFSGKRARAVSNHWPVWVYPLPGHPLKNLALLDPSGALTGWGEWLASLPCLDPGDPLDPYPLLLATTWNTDLARRVAEGGRVLLLQAGEAPLPSRRCPFWREAIKIFASHPMWERFPHPGYTGLQFFGLAGDVAFDTARLPGALPPGAEITPVLRRLDAREFHISEYLFEARWGSGWLLGCSLNIAGGVGSQPAGLRRNVAGAALLQAMLGFLAGRV
jgi:hypothetical protein